MTQKKVDFGLKKKTISMLSLLFILGGVFIAVTFIATQGRALGQQEDEGVEFKPPAVDLSDVPGLVNALDVVPDLLVEMKYSTEDNFLKRDLYGEFDECILNNDTADMLKKAEHFLRAAHPGLRLLAYDCLRPHRITQFMYDSVKGTPEVNYVANPTPGSVHNYGCAIDLTLANANGEPLDMGTEFDFFGKLAQPRHEIEAVRKGHLTAKEYANRLLLRQVMVGAGFLPIRNEWWHFDCATSQKIRERYRRIP